MGREGEAAVISGEDIDAALIAEGPWPQWLMELAIVLLHLPGAGGYSTLDAGRRETLAALRLDILDQLIRRLRRKRVADEPSTEVDSAVFLVIADLTDTPISFPLLSEENLQFRVRCELRRALLGPGWSRRAKGAEIPLEADRPTGAPDVEVLSRLELEQRLTRLWAVAPRREREVLAALRQDPDATDRDLAAALGCAPSTARTYLERLRRRAAGL